MKPIKYDEKIAVDISPFSALVESDIAEFIFDNAPRKVASRAFRALEHYERSAKLEGLDEEMGAMRLVAAEEELVVAIFEMLKLRANDFPEHQDFVKKFKNHVVKLAFYPVLLQFRFVIGDMLKDGFSLGGMEGLLSFTAKPVIDGKQIMMALIDQNGDEILRAEPFAIVLSRDDLDPKDVSAALLADLASIIKTQHRASLREFLTQRAEFRNHLLYATDAGSTHLGDKLSDLRVHFEQTYHDLLWALALVIGAKPPSKKWGIASQFVEVYRLALIEAGILKADNTIVVSPSEGESV